MTKKIIVKNHLSIEKQGLPEQVINQLKSYLVFTNPKWAENEKYGRWNKNTPKTLSFLTKDNNNWIIPRGFINPLISILERNGITFEVDDQTRCLADVLFKFKGKLQPFQKKAVTTILPKRYGILNAPTGAGKTVIALKIIAERKQPALVVVHTKELLYQWRDKAIEFLGIPENEIGLIGDGHKKVGNKLTIAIINSLYKCVNEVTAYTGFLIVDECHRIPSRTFTETVGEFDSKYMIGLSATPYRRDGLTKVLHFYLGDKIYDIDTKQLQYIKKIMTATLKMRETDFYYDYKFPEDYPNMITSLINNTERNQLITSDVIDYINKQEGIALVLSDRKDHCSILYDFIQKQGISTKLITGSTPNKERKTIIEALNHGTVKALVSTGQLIGEGFDLKELSAIFLTTPVKFSGRIIQYIGRILRIAKGKKKAIIYDYIDKIGVLQASFNSRLYAYQEIGVKV